MYSYNKGDPVIDPSDLEDIQSQLKNAPKNKYNYSKGAPVTDPNDLADIHEYEANQQKSSMLESFLGGVYHSGQDISKNVQKNIASLIDKGFGQGTADRLNQSIPSGLPDYLNRKAGFDPEQLKRFKNFLGMHVRATEKMNPLSEKFGEMAGNAAPFMIAPEVAGLGDANILLRSLFQGGTGAITSKNPLEGGLLGAGAELLSPVITTPLKWLGNKLTAPSSYHHGENLWEVAKGKLGHLGDETKIREAEGRLHNKVMKDAGELDKKYKGRISNESYIRALEDQADKVAGSLRHNPNSPQLHGEREQLLDWMNAPHDSLQGMIQHNKELNQVYGGDIKPGVPMREWLPSFAIKNIKKTIEENLLKNNFNRRAGKKLMNDIELANNATKERVKFNMFKDANSPEELLKTFNKMDKKTQENLFNDSDILRFHMYEKALNADKKSYTPKHLRGLREEISPLTKRLPGAMVVGGANQPISFLNEPFDRKESAK